MAITPVSPEFAVSEHQLSNQLVLKSVTSSGVPGQLLRRCLKKQQSLYLTASSVRRIEGDVPARIREARILQQELVGYVRYSAIGIDVLHVAESVDDVQM